ncbi:MAG: alpha/beta hydrolase [Deltaproteobacteria bacterium]|nr:alpha/beta hydrolase [Deltaproteobacteria bacterium]
MATQTRTAISGLETVRSHRLRNFILAVLVLILGALVFALLRPITVLRASGEFILSRAGIHSEYAQVGSYRIHYYAGGDGPPVVFVHGLTADALNWIKAMINLKAAGYRVYAIDLLGHGESDKPDIDYSIEQQTEMLRQFLATQHLQPADFVSVSLGGWITLNLAIEHPELVNRMVVADPAGLWFKSSLKAATFLPQNPSELRAFWDALSPRPYPLAGPLQYDYLRRVHEHNWIVQRIFASIMARKDLLDGRLDEIRAPVMLIWGKQEKLIPLAVGEQMHKEIPDSSLLVCPDSGHLAVFECWDRYEPDVIRYLSAPQPLPPESRELPSERQLLLK